MSDGGFVARLGATLIALFVVTFGMLDLDGPVADAYALVTLATAWLLLNHREANR